jgi:hypothetical protein
MGTDMNKNHKIVAITSEASQALKMLKITFPEIKLWKFVSDAVLEAISKKYMITNDEYRKMIERVNDGRGTTEPTDQNI